MVELTDSNFKKSVKKGEVIVDFYSEECIPCKAVEKKLIKLKNELNGGITICRMDVTQNPQTVARYFITTLPTLLLFKDGGIKEQINGNISLDKIKDRFNL